MNFKKFISQCLVISFIFSSNLFASEKDVYEFSWLDPDKEVFVLQNRKYRKVDSLYMNLGGGITTSGAFVDSKTIQFRAGYFFTEDLGVEGLYAKNSGQENDTALAVRNNNGLGTSGSTPFRRIVENYYGALLVWSPFYSKINTFNKIIYMDWIFGIGYGQLQENNNRLNFNGTALDDNVKTTEKHSGILWEVGMKFYLSEDFSIRTDLTAMHYSANKAATAGTAWNSNFDASVSLGYTF